MGPVIGILASVCLVEGGLHCGVERYFVSRDYIDAVVLAGGIPVILPLIEGWNAIRRQIGLLDGVLLVGGYDPDPGIYKEEPASKLGPVFPERDKYEIMVLATLQKKPALGICRGIQVMNVALGGTLYQDLSLVPRPVLQHFQDCQKHVAGHSIEINRGTLLREIAGSDFLRTNSYHHQSIKDLAPGLCINARAKDGVIEGVENREKTLLGVQWHPEMMIKKNPVMLNIFNWLIKAC